MIVNLEKSRAVAHTLELADTVCCFALATLGYLDDQGATLYVEGYVVDSSFKAFRHFWNEFEGEIIDPYWHIVDDDYPLAYFPAVRLTHAQVVAYINSLPDEDFCFDLKQQYGELYKQAYRAACKDRDLLKLGRKLIEKGVA